MSETEIARFDELLKHLATKEELASLKGDLKVDIQSVRTDMQRLRVELILWLIATNVAIGGAVIGVMLYLNNQTLVMLQHWKP